MALSLAWLRRCAHAALVVALAAAAAGYVLAAPVDAGHSANWAPLTLPFLAFAVTGWRVAAQRPRHPIGWLLLAVGTVPLATSLVQAYAVAAHANGWKLADEASWLGEVPWGAVWSCCALGLLLFPTGRLPSPGWRWVLRLTVLNAVVGTVFTAVALWPLRASLNVGLEATDGAAATVMQASFAAVGVSLVCASASLLFRYRRAAGEERAQLKWVTVAGGAVIVSVAAVIARNADAPFQRPLELVGALGIAAVPVAMAVAILRHRIYDVDRLLSRAVAWALVTGALVTVYATAVMVTGEALGAAGLSGEPGVAVATLAAATAFRPVRGRVQRAVDRRFDRARYDAEAVVASYRAALRPDSGADRAAAEALAAARRAVRPETATLWLRGGP